LLIKDAPEECLFECTVEVVDAELNHGSISYLHITDYTAIPGLPTTTTGSYGFDLYILRVALSYDQIQMAGLVPKGFYTIRKLRLQKIPGGNGVRGRLGGKEKLIYKLNVHESHDQHLQALIQRKQDWSAAQ